MRALRQLGGGIFLALLSVIIVVGGLSLALAEGYVPQPSPKSTATKPVIPSTPTGTTGIVLLSPTLSPILTFTASSVPPTNCPPPSGWVLVTIYPSDTLEVLASRYHTTVAALMGGNCLVSTNVLPGYGIYVPPVHTATFIPCGAPFGWVQYIVQPGDNLYQISQRYGVAVSQLQQANCLGYSTTIYTGQKLWVPNVITHTPSATPIDIIFDTSTPIPTDTPLPTSTMESTSTSTSIPPSETPAPTNTPQPTVTPTTTPTPIDSSPATP